MAAIFTDGAEQKKLAEASRDQTAKRLGKPVQKKLLAASQFWRAEDYHQKYYLRSNPALMRHFDAKGFVDSTAAAGVVAPRMNFAT
jgi:peptide-methionine (S)-S-oxide reductase